MQETVLALQSWSEIQADVAEYWYIYLAMPFAAAAIGYLTKILAVEMVYRPLEFRGIGPIGWQGVVPRRAGKVAAITTSLLVDNLLSAEELLDKIDSRNLVEAMRDDIEIIVEESAREFVEHLRPGLWTLLPEQARRAIRDHVVQQAPHIVERVLRDVEADLPRYIDLNFMFVTTMVRNKAQLTRVVRATGRSGTRFMRRSGIYFGFAIGIVQAAAWGWIHQLWIMPLFGFIVGWISDYLAITMLFEPIKPRKVLWWTIHGNLHRNRAQITREYAQIMANDLFSPEVMFNAMITGPSSDRIFALITQEISRMIDEEAGGATPLVQVAVGSKRYQAAKDTVAQRVLERLPDSSASGVSYAAEVLDVENTVRAKMNQLTSEQFESIMRPVFKDDEWLVIMLGAVVGAVGGELQVWALIHPFTDYGS
jgi:uncharacterized membrane protein YheB (UPF0754 family)